MLNLAELLDRAAETWPEREAIVAGDVRLTYADLQRASDQVAHLLVGNGIGPGDTVALSCPNIPAFTEIYFGILKAGAVVVPLNILLKANEIAYHLSDAGAKAYFCFAGTPELPMGLEGGRGFAQVDGCTQLWTITGPNDPPELLDGTATYEAAVSGLPDTFATVATEEDDTAVILYTSGTTGQPKGAELRHRNMRDNALTTGLLLEADPDRPDRSLCVLPLFHSFGQTVVQNTSIAHGGTIVLQGRFEAAATLQLMVKEKVTFFAGVPTMYWGLLGALDGGDVEASDVAENLRVAVAGGASLPVEIHKDFEARFGITIYEAYGLSETSPVATWSPIDQPARVGSIGVPIPGVELRLVVPGSWDEVEPGGDPAAVGEIAIRGHNVMKGYHGRPEATSEVIRDDWFRTGDIARRDSDGWYYIVDRAKDLIIRGGYNVYPREVEEVLMTHPDVSMAAVIGVPHEAHGEEIKAVVIRAEGATVTEAELVAWAKEQMASYKYPRAVEFVAQLPMTATGKILKRQLT